MKQYVYWATLLVAGLAIALGFQNCAPKNFTLTDEGAFSSLGALSTYEDVPAQMNVSSNLINPKYSIATTNGTLRTLHGVISQFTEDGKFLYTPDADFHGKDSFVFEVRGDHNQHFIKEAELIVLPVNDLPVVQDTQMLIELNKPLVFSVANVTATDVDKDVLNLWMVDANNQPINEKIGDWGSLLWLRAENGINFYEFKTRSLGAHTHKFMIDDGNGGKVNFNITFTAENPLLAFKPALAVRNMACLNCHANIRGNIITDFRASSGQQVHLYGPETGAGDFLNGNWNWRARTFSSLNLHNGTYFVPKRSFSSISQAAVTGAFTQGRDTKIRNLPSWGGNSNPVDATAYDSSINVGASTIADYLNAAINHRTPGYLTEIKNDPQFPKSTTIEQNSSIREVRDVKISGVSKSQLESVFGSEFKYIRQGDDGYALKNFQKTGQYYSNTPDQWMECDGDLYVPGVVLLKHLKVKSKYGCRIHASGSVFVQAPTNTTQGRQGIDYDNPKSHLQIMSSKAVLFGLGDCSYQGAMGGDSFMHRVNDERTNTPTLANLGVPSEYALFLGSDGQHTVRDASNCEGDYKDARRNVAFSRLLVNAQVVHSRYTGNFTGAIIADHMVGSLGKFAYEYDPIFTASPIFPQIPSNWFFSVEDCATYDPVTGQRISDQSVSVTNEPKLRKCQ